MSFKVKSHSSLSKDLTVGEIEIGYHVAGSAKEHWKNIKGGTRVQLCVIKLNEAEREFM